MSAGRGRPKSVERETARAAGLKTYEGTACRNCETVVKYVSNGRCVQCSKGDAAQKRARARTVRNWVVGTFHGLLCQRCGTTERYVSNAQCVNCKRASQAQRLRP